MHSGQPESLPRCYLNGLKYLIRIGPWLSNPRSEICDMPFASMQPMRPRQAVLLNRTGSWAPSSPIRCWQKYRMRGRCNSQNLFQNGSLNGPRQCALAICATFRPEGLDLRRTEPGATNMAFGYRKRLTGFLEAALYDTSWKKRSRIRPVFVKN